MSNQDQVKEIAVRMKALREINGVSLESLAKKLNIDAEVYAQYEEAVCDIPIGFLYEFAKYFNMDLTTILTGGEPKLQVYEVVRKGQGLSVNRRKQYEYRNLAYNFVRKNLEPFLVTVPASDEDTPIQCSVHEGQEFNYVLEGRMIIKINQHEITLEEGDAIYFNAKCQHGMKALDGKEAKFLAIITQ